MSRRRCRVQSVVVAVGLAVCGATAWAGDPAAEELVEAVWRVRVVDLAFSSPTTYYACDALQTKIGAILKAVGAHQGVKVVMGCKDRSFVNAAHARILVAFPTEATDAFIAAATTYSPRQELAARVRGEPLPSAADIERFPASWQRVSLSAQAPARLEPGDCDLLRDLSEQVFPKLGIRPATRIGCYASATRVKPDMDVDALVRVAAPAAAETLPPS